jgi:two-component system, chemotaxis family, CheB/CheR fusion protein
LAELAKSRAQIAPLIGSPSAAESNIGEDDETALKRIFEVVRSRTGHDFSRYKRATILRRLGRRMQLDHRSGLDRYLAFLRETPEEIQSLFDDLLISVTTFFRILPHGKRCASN